MADRKADGLVLDMVDFLAASISDGSAEPIDMSVDAQTNIVTVRVRILSAPERPAEVAPAGCAHARVKPMPDGTRFCIDCSQTLLTASV